MKLNSTLYGRLDGKGVWGRMNTCIYMAESTVNLKLLQHCYLAIPEYKIKKQNCKFVNILSVLRELMCVIDVIQDSPGGTRSKEPTWHCRILTDIDSIPGSGISRGRGHDNPVQYCLENPMGIGAWWATVHGVAKSQT